MFCFRFSVGSVMPVKRLRAASWSGLFGVVLVAGVLTGGTAAHVHHVVAGPNTILTALTAALARAHPRQPFCKIADANTKVQQGDTVLVTPERTTTTSSINPAVSVCRAARSPSPRTRA